MHRPNPWQKGCLVVLVCLATILVLGRCFEDDEPASRGRLVLLVAVDDLRRDHLAFHGYELDPTPALSELARAGVVAEDYVPASTATAPSLAALLTGLGPAETGFTSARELGAHRLPRAVPTLAAELAEAGWRTVGVFALPQDADRLTGLARGFEDVLEAPLAGPPLDAAAAAAGLARIVRESVRESVRGIRTSEPLFAFLHLGDLRADLERVDATRLAPWLERRLAPFRAGQPELAAELDRLSLDPAAAAGRIEQLVGRKRGSAAWLALQSARYDARLAALDGALAALLRELDELGRTDRIVIVAGTRGRLLGVEPPDDGPPIALSEALLRTALVVSGPELDPAWKAVDRPQRAVLALRAQLAGHGDAPAEAPRLVAAGESGLVALVERDHKDVFEPGRERRFDRAGDRVSSDAPGAGPFGSREPAFGVLRLASAWELEVAPAPAAELHLRFGSVANGITGASALTGAETLAPATGRSADLRFAGAGFARVSTRATTTPLTLTISGAGGDLGVALPERVEPPRRERAPAAIPGAWTAATLSRDVPPLVSELPPVFPSRAEQADDGAEPARPHESAGPRARDGTEWPTLHVAREGAWRRVTLVGVRADDEVALALWLFPPHAEEASERDVDRVRGVTSVAAFPGLGAIVAGGRGPLELRIAFAAGQRLAVAAEVAGETLPAAAMTSEEGGDPAALALYLPPVDLLAFDVTAAGACVLRAVRARPGLALEPPYGLTADDVRFLRRLGPLE